MRQDRILLVRKYIYSSDERVGMVEKKATKATESPKAESPKVEAPKTESPKPKTTKTASAVQTSQKTNIYAVIYSVVKENGGKLPLEKLESLCQQRKKLSDGSYASYAKTRFVFKDGLVYPQINDRGFKDALTYMARRHLTTPHWVIQTFPEEAADAAKRLGLPLPKADPSSSVLSEPRRRSASSYLTPDGHLVNGGACPKCAEILAARRGEIGGIKS
jgi:hypothetical protein